MNAFLYNILAYVPGLPEPERRPEFTFEYIFWPLLVGVLVAVLFAVLLTVLAIRFHVPADEKVAAINELLPGANCGACGFAGCEGFAKALAEEKIDLKECGPADPSAKEKIFGILGKEGSFEATFAVVACNGGVRAKDRFEYVGYETCVAVAATSGGHKFCSKACFGFGDCIAVCPVDAIILQDNQVVDIDHKCISCGLCVKKCPNKVIKIIPAKAPVFVACNSNCRGADVTKICETGCHGCTLCERACPTGAIKMENNLPVWDYEKCTSCMECVKKCPRDIIFDRTHLVPPQ
ncbi:MAG: RnfABCDGE type electron transport complex subunit B [Firmicutes bacterium]|nr:RnfABCDGE type electron transport complex subunit B [Bacillota bacterium]